MYEWSMYFVEKARWWTAVHTFYAEIQVLRNVGKDKPEGKPNL